MRLLSGFAGCTCFLAVGSTTSLLLSSLSLCLGSLALLSGCSLALLLLLSCVARCLVRVGGRGSAGSLLTLLSSLESRCRALLSLSSLLLSTLGGLLLSTLSLLLSLTSLLLAIAAFATSLRGGDRCLRSTWLVAGQSRAIA
jgi:hypothetical protein